MIIRLSGKNAHAAHPEEGISPAMALSQLIQTFSAVPQFYSSLEESVKVTVIHAEMGERAFGTSPAKAILLTTLRTYNNGTLERLKKKCQQLAEKTAENFGLDVSCEWVEAFPATVNDPDSVAIVRKVAKRKALNIKEKSSPFSWSEDFGHFIASKKGAMFGLGAGESQSPLHAEDYDFPDEIISTGIKMFTGIIEELNKEE
jgi:metal-dependent amidase/aminoacylase/carboxypeptidase family protein